MKVTRHAYQRYSQRTELKTNQRTHDAKQAWKHGYKIGEFKDPFYTYLYEKQLSGDRTGIKVWGENIYVFDNRHKRLLTVYPVPEEFLPIKNFLGTDNFPCVIQINGDYFATEDGENPIIFKSKQSANNYIKNNHDLDCEEVVVIPYYED